MTKLYGIWSVEWEKWFKMTNGILFSTPSFGHARAQRREIWLDAICQHDLRVATFGGDGKPDWIELE